MYNGELLYKLSSHNNEVKCFRIDYLNNMLVSGSWDSSIKIQKLTEMGFEVKR